jgi:tRNA(Ile)-lysidine synthase
LISRSLLGELPGVTGPLLGRCRFPPAGTTVELAVSGGADSLALLVRAAAAGTKPVAHHVDHRLRRGSAGEADEVATVAELLGAGFVAHEVDVRDGPNLEARARAARYAVLPAGVATGHTADDQAETVLVNLLRGAGPDGVAGLSAGVRHPILALRRAETHRLCEDLDLSPLRDPTNEDSSHLRNQLRHETLPLLSAAAGRDLVPVLARQAELFASESAFLDELAASIDPCDARALTAAPPVLARRAVRRWLRGADAEGHPPSGAVVERVLSVASMSRQACEIGGGLRVRRSAGRLFLEPTS